MINGNTLKNFAGNIIFSAWDYIRRFVVWIYEKLIKVSLWQRVLYMLAGLFLLILIISLFWLAVNGSLASLLLCISFGALLFIDILIIVLFYYDIKSKNGMELFINEFNEVSGKFSRLTEKSELSIPWFLLLGDKNTGKTELVEKSDIHFFKPKEIASPEIRTYFNKSMLLWKYDINEPEVKTGEETETQDKKDLNNDFDTFLQFLRTRKNLLNLNGILLSVSADELINNNKEYITQVGKKYSELINHIQQTLGICIPLHLVVTKSDKICGFNEFVRNLEPKFYNQIFGWTNKLNLVGEKFSSKDFLNHMDSIVENTEKQRFSFLHKFISESSKSEYYDTASYFAFSENLRRISLNVAALTDAITLGVYANSRLLEKKYNIVPMFVRGIYFTSAEQNTGFYDKLFYSEANEKVEFKRKRDFAVQVPSLFIKQFIENVLYKDRDISMRITSLRKSYKWKRIAGISAVFGLFAFLIIFTSIYWVNVFSYISFDKSNLNTAAKQSVRSNLLYPSKDVRTVNARNNYLTLLDDMDQMNSNIETDNTALVDTAVPQITVHYTKLNDYKINQIFNPDYFTAVTNEWKNINSIVDRKVEVIHLNDVKSRYAAARTNYYAYLDQYFMYWNQILNEASQPEVVQWDTLKNQRYQYWQIANSYRKTAEVIGNAFNVYSNVTKGLLTPERTGELDIILKSLDGMNTNFANSFIQNKAVALISFWDRIFIAPNSIKSRDIIFRTNDDILYKEAVFKYTQKNQYRNYYQEYWEGLSLMFFQSLGDQIRTNAGAYITDLEHSNEFPVDTYWQRNNGMTITELKKLEDNVYKYWPSKSAYPENTACNGSINLDPSFDEAVNQLRPNLQGDLMKKAVALKSLIVNILPENGKSHTLKVYLLPPEDGQQDNTGADYWTIMKMSQAKSLEKTVSVRTRSSNLEYLCELTYPSTGKIRFDFFRTVESLKGYNPNASLAMNGIWGPLRLLFNGPSRPQAFRGEYWTTWKNVKQIDDNTWISKISFIKNDGKKVSFYVKLVYSSNISSITKLT
ncbi:MAG TPA: type VI secretion system protein [Victivallales bacterium]|nr:type VI secretion system protein [Victivallales bacterium]